jgi:hypothetical protein
MKRIGKRQSAFSVIAIKISGYDEENQLFSIPIKKGKARPSQVLPVTPTISIEDYQF